MLHLPKKCTGPVATARRDDIDGLRTISIVAVVLYHSGFATFGGGFVGVDVFFVISGYLITAKILKECDRGTWSLVKFWEARFRRLLPGMAIVLVATYVAAFFYLTPTAFKDFSDSLFASGLQAANLFFWSQTGYFDTAADTKPLLHLWSLGVEMQFYLVFPIALVPLVRWMGFRAITVILALGFTSFAYAIWLVNAGDTDAAFYNPVARFWELMVGGALAAGRISVGRLWSLVFAIAGLVLIVGSVVYYSVDTAFPGLTALPPVLGAAMLISAGTDKNVVSRIFATTPMAAIGRVSYGWYLWHWPIIVFLPMAFEIDEATQHWFLLAGALVGLLLAFASAHLIENPIIRKRTLTSSRAVYAMTSTVVAFFIAASLPGQMPSYAQNRAWILNGETGLAAFRIAEEERFYLTQINLNADSRRPLPEVEGAYRYTCSYDRGNDTAGVLGCVKRLAEDRNVVIAGDSIGRDTFHSLRLAYPDINFIMVHNSGCPPFEMVTERFSCFPGLSELVAGLGAEVSVDGVVMAFRYRPDNIDRIAGAIDTWQSEFPKILVLGVTPVFAKSVQDYVAVSPNGVPLLVSLSDHAMVPWSYADLAEATRPTVAEKSAEFVDITGFWCPEGSCPLWVNDDETQPIYWDQQHITRFGMEHFAGYLKANEKVKQFLGR